MQEYTQTNEGQRNLTTTTRGSRTKSLDRSAAPSSSASGAASRISYPEACDDVAAPADDPRREAELEDIAAAAAKPGVDGLEKEGERCAADDVAGVSVDVATPRAAADEVTPAMDGEAATGSLTSVDAEIAPRPRPCTARVGDRPAVVAAPHADGDTRAPEPAAAAAAAGRDGKARDMWLLL